MADQFTPTPVKTKTAGDVAVKVVDTAGSNLLVVDSSGAASVNMTKVGSTAVDTNSGNKSAGTQRVVLATDQPNLTSALNVTMGATSATTGTLASAANGTALACSGMGSVAFDLYGTFVATAKIEYSIDGGTTYATVGAEYFWSNGFSGPGSSTLAGMNSASNGIIDVATLAATHVRVVTTAYTSGTMSYTLQPIAATRPAVMGASLTRVGGTLLSVNDGVADNGALRVAVAGTLADNGAVFTDGTTKLFPVGFIYDEVAGTTLTENDAGAARIDIKRAQVLTLEDATTRGQRLAVSSAGAAAVNVAQVLGATHATTNPVFVRLTDGTTSIGTTNPLPVTIETTAGTLTDSGHLTAAALAAGASTTTELNSAAVSSGTAKLLEFTVSSSVRTKIVVKTGTTGAPTTVRTFFCEANQSFVYQPKDPDEITFAGGALKCFQLIVTNMDNALAADVYASITHVQV